MKLLIQSLRFIFDLAGFIIIMSCGQGFLIAIVEVMYG